MHLLGSLHRWQLLTLEGLGVLLVLLLLWRFAVAYRQRRQGTDPHGDGAKQRLSHFYPLGKENGQNTTTEWEQPFARFLTPLVLIGEPFPPPNEQMLKSLLCYRFPFTPQNLDMAFPEKVQAVLQGFPPVLIQLLHKHHVPIELDVVCDIPAMMDPGAPKLMLSRSFVLGGQLFDIEDNPVYPYDLCCIILHETGHFLDWFLFPESGRLSATPAFLQAFQEDGVAIPPALIQSYETCLQWKQQYGGYLKLPRSLRYQSDLSLFLNQEEELFSEAFVYLMTGRGREVVLHHFPKTIKAVEQLLRDSFQTVARPSIELFQPSDLAP